MFISTVTCLKVSNNILEPYAVIRLNKEFVQRFQETTNMHPVPKTAQVTPIVTGIKNAALMVIMFQTDLQTFLTIQ